MMNTKSAWLIRSLLFPMLLLAASQVSAVANFSQIERLFEDAQYEKTLEAAKAHKGSTTGLMFLAFANLQLYEFTNAKHYKNQYKSLFDNVEAKAGVDDLPRILYFVNRTSMPPVVKEATKLAKNVFKSLYKMEDIAKLTPFVKADDKNVKKYALDAIERILKPKRKMVEKGGTLRSKDIAVMQNPQLIQVLLMNASESSARGALEAIEQPVLSHTAKYMDKNVAKVEMNINKDIAKRKKKYPNSNWYSATGKKY